MKKEYGNYQTEVPLLLNAPRSKKPYRFVHSLNKNYFNAKIRESEPFGFKTFYELVRLKQLPPKIFFFGKESIGTKRIYIFLLDALYFSFPVSVSLPQVIFFLRYSIYLTSYNIYYVN